MVLGYGFHGGKGRCYNLWMDFVNCIDKARYDSYKDCKYQREDYYECLHQTKLRARLDVIERQKKKLIREGSWPPK